MPCITSNNQEDALRKWMQDNPSGFVVNTTRKYSSFKLHVASCGHFSKTINLTTHKYIKVCSNNITEIQLWVATNNRPLTQHDVCKDCLKKIRIDDIDFQQRDFDNVVTSINHLSEEELRNAAGNYSPKPKMGKSTTTHFFRNPYIVQLTLRHANGVCAQCGNAAPFKRRDGTPYLEVHHIVPLSLGGEDTEENCEALCPNCHRKKHHG